MEKEKIGKLAVVETDRIGSDVTIAEFSVVSKGAPSVGFVHNSDQKFSRNSGHRASMSVFHRSEG